MRFFLLFAYITAFVWLFNAEAQQNINSLTTKDIKVNGNLEVNSTSLASKPCPVVTEAQRNAIASPQSGRCVYNSNTNQLNIFNGTIWKSVGGGISNWETAFNYAVNDVVIESNKIYQCNTAHTSSVFASDIANWTQISNNVSDVTGVLPMANGGTDKNLTPTLGGVVYTDANSMEVLGAGTSGQVLKSNGAAAPTWQDASNKIEGLEQTESEFNKVQFKNKSVTETAAGVQLVETERSLLANGSFEHLSYQSSWTITGSATISRETSIVRDGKVSLKAVTTGNSFRIEQTTTQLAGTNVAAYAVVWVNNTASGVQICSMATGSDKDCVTALTDGTWQPYIIPMILGATSNGIAVKSGTTTGTTYVDWVRVVDESLASNAPVVTPWVSYGATVITTGTSAGISGTPPTKGTTSVDNVECRQVGPDYICNYDMVQTAAGTTGSGIYLIKLPNGVSFNDSELVNTVSITNGLMSGTEVANLHRGGRDLVTSGHSTGAAGDVSASNLPKCYRVYQDYFSCINVNSAANSYPLGSGGFHLAQNAFSMRFSIMFKGKGLQSSVPVYFSADGTSSLRAGQIITGAFAACPQNTLEADGRQVSRTTYPQLFSALGTSHGQGDGSTTFNLPDYRGQFLRGRIAIANVTGSGSAASNQATFTNHGFNRTGLRVRLASGTLSGLAASTNYYVIVVDANTLAFATTRANALSNTRIAISGTNTAVIQQWEDVDASTRQASNVGGSTGTNVGSIQEDALQNITGNVGSLGFSSASGAFALDGEASGFYAYVTGGSLVNGSFNASRVARTSDETRPSNVYVRYCIQAIDTYIVGSFRDYVRTPNTATGKVGFCSAKISATGVISDQLGGCFASCTNATSPACTFTSNYWKSGSVPNCWHKCDGNTTGDSIQNTSTVQGLCLSSGTIQSGSRAYFCHGELQ